MEEEPGVSVERELLVVGLEILGGDVCAGHQPPARGVELFENPGQLVDHQPLVNTVVDVSRERDA